MIINIFLCDFIPRNGFYMQIQALLADQSELQPALKLQIYQPQKQKGFFLFDLDSCSSQIDYLGSMRTSQTFSVTLQHNIDNLNFHSSFQKQKNSIQQIYNIQMNQVAQRKHSQNHYEILSDTSAGSCDYEQHLPTHENQHPKMNRATNSKAKSSLCKNYMEKGECPYGSKCQFAHGPHELKCNSSKTMSYKTRPCYGFAKKGYCSFGSRCNFLHQEEERESCASYLKQYRQVLLNSRGGEGSILMKILE